MLTNSNYHHRSMVRFCSIFLSLSWAIFGSGCSTPRVASIGTVQPNPSDKPDDELVPAVEQPINQSQTTEAITESNPTDEVVSAQPKPSNLTPTPPVSRPATPLEQAETLLAQGDFEQALDAFADLLLNNPGLVEAYMGLANTHERLENPWAAERSWRRAIELKPDDPQVVLRHANVLYEIGRSKEAERHWIRCLTLAPNSVEPLVMLATLELDRDQAQAALPYARSSVRLAPKHGPGRAVYARALLVVGQASASIAHWSMAIEALPDDFSLLAGLLEAYAACQDYEGALATALVLERRASSAGVLERIGWCYFKLGRDEESRVAYQKSTELDSGCTPAWNGLGILALNRWLDQDRQNETDRKEAMSAFRKSLRSKSDQPKLARMILQFDLDR